jgi:hypothetical protein
MTILEHTPERHEILDFIDESIRQLQSSGAEAKYIILGAEAYLTLRQAIAERFHRKPKDFETYNYLPLVLDPFRTGSVCVLPGPGEVSKGVQAYRIPTT